MRTASVLAILALVVSGAGADTLHLRNGGTIDGIVTQQGDLYVVEVPFGTMKIGQGEVVSVERKDTPLSEHRRRAAALGEKDADGWFKLGEWAKVSRLDGLAEEDLRRVIAIDPDHAGARAALGYEKVDGKWLTHDEAMAAKGFVKVEGTWVTREAGELLKALAESKLLQAQARAAEAKAQAEADLAAEQASIAERQERLLEQEREAQIDRELSYQGGSVAGYFYGYPYGVPWYGSICPITAWDPCCGCFPRNGCNNWCNRIWPRPPCTITPRAPAPAGGVVSPPPPVRPQSRPAASAPTPAARPSGSGSPPGVVRVGAPPQRPPVSRTAGTTQQQPR